jgi:hypothetical protein
VPTEDAPTDELSAFSFHQAAAAALWDQAEFLFLLHQHTMIQKSIEAAAEHTISSTLLAADNYFSLMTFFTSAAPARCVY